MSPPRKKGKKDAARALPTGLHSGVICFEVDFRKFYSESKSVQVGGVTWKAELDKDYGNRSFYSGNANLAISLHTEDNPSPLWSIDVDSQLVLYNSDSSKNIVKEKTHTFDRQSHEWKDIIIPWDEPEKRTSKGYHKFGKLIVIINFAITKMTGFGSTPHKIDFTDGKEPSHDVALKIGKEKIYANKGILASHSPLFYAMFYGDSNDKDKKEFELKDVDRKEFIEMLNVIYPFHKKVADENVKLLLKMGNRFEFKTVLDLVETHLITSDDQKLVPKLLLSDQFKLTKLQGHCINKVDSYKWNHFKSSTEYNELSDDLKEAIEVVLERKKRRRSPDSENSEY